MKLTKNEAKILKLLISSSDYITTYDISASTGISRRMVREEMNSVKQILESLNLTLLSKPSKGYFIEGKSSEIISSLNDMINKSQSEQDTLFPTLPQERQNYIQKRLIDTHGYIKIDTLAEELIVSRSTISNDVIAIRKNIKKYNLTITQKPNYGICICGHEIGQRKCLADYYFTNLRLSNIFYDFIDSYRNTSDYQIIQSIKDYGVEMSDIGLIDFLVCLSISIARVKDGYCLSEPQDFKKLTSRAEYQAALKISEYIDNQFQIKFNEFETQYIAGLLILKRSTKGLSPTVDPHIIQIAQEIMEEIEKQTLICIKSEHINHVLPLYVKQTLLRQKHNEKIRNPLYEDIKLTYPLAYELALITSKIIEKHSKQKISSSEIASFATLFNNAIHNQTYKKKNILLLNALGYNSEHLCSYLIHDRFSNKLTVKKVIQYYKVNDEDFSQYDLVITTVPIHKKLPIPCIEVTYMMNQEDLNKIDNYISYTSNNESLIYYFHPKLFKNHVQIKTKKGLISEFYQLLKNIYPYIKESFKTEIMSDNGYSLKTFNDIGLIHLNKPLCGQNIIAVIILEQPIIFDNRSLKTFILYSGIENNNLSYNTLFNILCKLSNNDETLNKLNNQPDYVQFLKIIKHGK